MRNKIKIFALLVITLSLSSCYSYKNMRYLQDRKELPSYEKVDYVDYRIQVNDEIIFRLITADETLSKLISPQISGGGGAGQNMISYRVQTDGTIDLPFVSGINIKGLTLKEATKSVEDRIREYLPDAVIKLGLSNKTFTIFGDVGIGVFPLYKEKMTIFEALAVTGDFDDTSDRKHIRIIRETENGTRVFEFDIRPKSIIDSKYYYIYPNDIIYIRRKPASFFMVSHYKDLIGIVSFSVQLLFSVLNYTK